MTQPLRIGVVLDPTGTDPQHRDIWQGACRYGAEHGWHIALDPYADAHPADHYDGVITHAGPWRYRRTPTVPLVCVTYYAMHRRISRVTPDRTHGGRLAALHLHERDYPHFAAVGQSSGAISRAQLDGFLAVTRRRGLGCSSLLLGRHYRKSPRRWSRFNAIVGRWLDKLEYPVGILAADDLLARDLAEVCLRKGLRVPDDVGIVGAGNLAAVCEQPEPTLTSIDYGLDRVGYRAAAALEQLIGGAPGAVIVERVRPTGVVARRSTDRRLSDNPAVATAVAWIAAHCERPIRVGEVAEAAGVSAWTLGRLMREVRGHTVAHEVALARLHRAMGLLETTSRSIGRVAEQAGYSSIHALETAFREHAHTTPRGYRKAAAARRVPDASPIVQAKQLLRETGFTLERIAELTGYGTAERFARAFIRAEGVSPGAWRQVHGGVRQGRREPAPTVAGVPRVSMHFDGPDDEPAPEEE